MKKLLNFLKSEEHSGAVAFEYIIVLIIMAVAIFIAWTLLSDQLYAKARDFRDFMNHNGQRPLDETMRWEP